MELSELTVRSFANLLGSDAPAPGGGSASALAGSLGAALIAMVNALTLGRKKYADYQALSQECFEHASLLKDRFLSAMEHDTEVFNEFSTAMALPKETPEEKAARSAAMQDALKLCIESPLHMMELCFETVKLADSSLGKTNANALSDLGVGALMLSAAVHGAWLNVLINLGALKDEAAAAAYRTKGEELLNDTVTLSHIVYEKVVNAL
ncbi:MAG: cyclodeaminase/cyclohydrolase family protein [Oscillospiraceae bacterium]|nr:cyclodeaminase/cyclohydrolase family protein [Oscillospiraceae bacterium]